jgi:hypothetical protein
MASGDVAPAPLVRGLEPTALVMQSRAAVGSPVSSTFPDVVCCAFWSWVSDNVLALATLALVAVTWRVAAQTRAATNATIRPLLADIPRAAHATPTTVDYGSERGLTGEASDVGMMHAGVGRDFYGGFYGLRSIALRNIGNGPAWVMGVELDVEEATPSSPPVCSSFPSIVPRDETVRLMAAVQFQQEPTPAAITTYTGFVITAEYTDIARRQRQRVSVPVVLQAGAHGAQWLQQGEILTRSVKRGELLRRRISDLIARWRRDA